MCQPFSLFREFHNHTFVSSEAADFVDEFRVELRIEFSQLFTKAVSSVTKYRSTVSS